MIICKHAADLSLMLDPMRKSGKKIGFVPTMGALHEGHISLIREAKDNSDVVVVSIFVNPTQFNQSADLEEYPRPVTEDIRLLCHENAAFLYLPDVDDVYQNDADRDFHIDLGYLDEVMEGAFRPGHFNGVAQVMHVLLDRIAPDLVFMGQKDFQQLAVVRKMMQVKDHHTMLVSCPTIREIDGLAMSSRNRRLPPHIRRQANLIYHTLLYAKTMQRVMSIRALEQACMERLNQGPFRPEYFSIVGHSTLKKKEDWSDTDACIACTAVWAGDVRLIDNMLM